MSATYNRFGTGSGEVAFDEIHRLRDGRVGLRGEHLLRPRHPAHPGELHEPRGLVTPDVPPLPPEERMHLPDAVDAVVLLVKTLDLGDEEFVL